MTRYCANCGTEVDDSAIFCPTCGQPIDQDTETEMPQAPAWPEPDPRAAAAAPAAREPQPQAAPEPGPGPEQGPLPAPEPPPAASVPSPPEERREWQRDEAPARAAASAASFDDPTRTNERQEPPAQPPPPAPSPDGPVADRPAGQAAGPAVSVPFTAPVTLSAWLIGIGTALAALGALIGLFDSSGAVIDLLAFVALLGVAITVFFTTALPAIPHLRFITLVVVLVAFGIGLDRLGAGGAGAGDLLLFIGAAAAVIGAVLLELGHDQPLGGPQS